MKLKLNLILIRRCCFSQPFSRDSLNTNNQVNELKTI